MRSLKKSMTVLVLKAECEMLAEAVFNPSCRTIGEAVLNTALTPLYAAVGVVYDVTADDKDPCPWGDL